MFEGSDPLSQTLNLGKLYRAVRQQTIELTDGFTAEDLSGQSMPDASPGKWHLAHTSWFFEVMILSQCTDYVPVNHELFQLFNSYYDAFGPRVPRAKRGAMTRPSLDQILSYRTEIDRRMSRYLEAQISAHEAYLVELGLNHEQQHQELMVQDLLHLFSLNPLNPAMQRDEGQTKNNVVELQGAERFNGGLVNVGAATEGGFAFDNEKPQHKVWLEPFSLAHDLVSNAHWKSFIDDGGYCRAELWLADGWSFISQEKVAAPLYWREQTNGIWLEFGICGLKPINMHQPVRHISFYEADAYARWAGRRLPTEFEWEFAVTQSSQKFANLYSDTWQWTSSSYAPYPGFQPTMGTASEYNGKFMANQMVLRGGSFATPIEHQRVSYRNFYYPYQRWMPSGLRLADSGSAQW